MSIESKQWFSVVSFLTKMKKGLYQEMFENKSLPQKEFLPKISLKKIKWFSIFLQQIIKRNLRKKKGLWREISTK